MLCEVKSFPKIVNYVCTVHFETNQDPRRIAMYTPNATRSSSHSPRFPALRIHVKDSANHSNNLMTLVFAGGSTVITGGFTYHAALRDAQRRRLYVESIPQPCVILDDDNYPVRIELRRLATMTEFRHFRPVNIVVNGLVAPYAISLAAIMRAYPDESKHQPMNFPALKYDLKPENWPGVTVPTASHIFDTGKNVIMGGKSMHQMHVSQQCLEHIANSFYDPNAPKTPKERYEHRLRALRDISHKIRATVGVRSFLSPALPAPVPRTPPEERDPRKEEEEEEAVAGDDAVGRAVRTLLQEDWVPG